MNSKLVTCILAMLVPLGAEAQSGTRPSKKTPKTSSSHSEKKYDLARSASYSGEVIRGPRRIAAENLNVLRYDYKWNSAVSFQAAPDLWSKLTGVNTTPAAAAPADPKSPKGPGLSGKEVIPADTQATIDKVNALVKDTEAQIKPIVDFKAEIQTDLASLQSQQARADQANAQVANAGKSLTDFLKANNGTSAQLITAINDQLADFDTNPAAKDSVFVVGIKARWADQNTVAQIRDSSKSRSTRLEDLRTKFASFVPQRAAALESVKGELNSLVAKLTPATNKPLEKDQAQISALKDEIKDIETEQQNLTQTTSILDWDIKVNGQITSAVPDLDQSGSKYTAFQTAQDALGTWKRKMENIQRLWQAYSKTPSEGPNPFSMQIDTDCEFAFSRTKQTTVTLVQTDLLPGSTTTPTTVLSVIVECTSPFTISAGVAFSSIRQKEFAIQPVATPPGSTTTTNQFVATNNSAFHPLPLAIAHARFAEPNETVAFHISLGIAGNFQSQNSGGSSAAFLIGPSISLFRTMFFTPGVIIERKVELGAGFKVGQVAPPNVTTPPLQNSYTGSFGFAITFTKP